jgi:hypothetical protein
MRHTFSVQFLKKFRPATTFGEAWENLCLSLLRADSGDNTFMRLTSQILGRLVARRYR